MKEDMTANKNLKICGTTLKTKLRGSMPYCLGNSNLSEFIAQNNSLFRLLA